MVCALEIPSHSPPFTIPLWLSIVLLYDYTSLAEGQMQSSWGPIPKQNHVPCPFHSTVLALTKCLLCLGLSPCCPAPIISPAWQGYSFCLFLLHRWSRSWFQVCRGVREGLYGLMNCTVHVGNSVCIHVCAYTCMHMFITYMYGMSACAYVLCAFAQLNTNMCTLF